MDRIKKYGWKIEQVYVQENKRKYISSLYTFIIYIICI